MWNLRLSLALRSSAVLLTGNLFSSEVSDEVLGVLWVSGGVSGHVLSGLLLADMTVRPMAAGCRETVWRREDVEG